MAPRAPVDGFAAGTMLLLCAVWGAQQVAIKLAAPDVTPVVQVAIRYAVSTVVVGALVLRATGAAPATGGAAEPAPS